MMQVPQARPQQVYQPAMQPSYNAVKIDIHNPSVNATPCGCCNTTPPATSVYEMPQQSVYAPAK